MFEPQQGARQFHAPSAAGWVVLLAGFAGVLPACGQEDPRPPEGARSAAGQPAAAQTSEARRDAADVPAAPATQTAPAVPQLEGVTRDADGTLHWPQPRTDDRRRERHAMVAEQIARESAFRENVKDRRVLDALRNVPRHQFVPAQRRAAAYDDTPLPIGHGQTISQPYIVALMTDLLEIEPGDRVLEIGTGSGYQAAVLAELTPYVYTIEILEPLYEPARRTLADVGYTTVQTRLGDGYDGWPEVAPFDGIIVTCAAGHVPPPLWQQLAPGGRMVIPIGGVYETQRLLVLEKDARGQRRSRSVLAVRFVPMTGKAQAQ